MLEVTVDCNMQHKKLKCFYNYFIYVKSKIIIMSQRIRNKINNAIKAADELMETEIQAAEEIQREKIRKEIIRCKVMQLTKMENYEEQIKENMLIGQKLTNELLIKNK